MTDYDDFPSNIQQLIDELRERGFEIHYGEVQGERATPGFVAKREDGGVVQVTNRVQTWFVTMRNQEKARIDDCWDRPRRIRNEVEDWLDETGGDDGD